MSSFKAKILAGALPQTPLGEPNYHSIDYERKKKKTFYKTRV